MCQKTRYNSSKIRRSNNSCTNISFNGGKPWVKKDDGSFNITMGAYDGAELCELISIYMFFLLEKRYDSIKVEPYRDDGLALFKNVSEPAIEKMKIYIFFRQEGFLAKHR